MTGILLTMPVLRAVDANGAPMPGALLQFYVTGTTTPTNAYTSATLGVALSNPVVADAGGLFVPIYLDPTVTYRVQLQTAVGAVIRDIDPVAAPIAPAAGSITAAMVQAGVALANLGFTPVNKAGDTATNLLLANTTLATNSAGYMGAPVNEQDAAYTFALSDAGKMVRGAPSAGIAYSLPPVSAVAWTRGTVILVRNANLTNAITVARGTGVSIFGAGGSTNKDWVLAANGMATLIMEDVNEWVISGVGIS